MIKINHYLAILFFISSCTVHTGALSGNNAGYNDRTVAIGYGIAEKTAFLGIGGLHKGAMVLEAKKNMYLNHPLKYGQAFSDYSVDFVKIYYPFVTNLRVMVSAEIIEEYKDHSKDKIEKNILTHPIYYNPTLAIGDSVQLNISPPFIKAVVRKIEINKVTVAYTNNRGMLEFRGISTNEAIVLKARYQKYKPKTKPKNNNSMSSYDPTLAIGDTLLLSISPVTIRAIIQKIEPKNVVVGYINKNGVRKTKRLSTHTAIAYKGGYHNFKKSGQLQKK